MTWRWPWVSRSAHEATIAIYEGIVAHERAKQRESSEKFTEWFHGQKELYADLLARYHMLKLQGAVAVEPSMTGAVAVKPDPVKVALAVACRGNPDLLKQQERAVQRDRDAGLSDEEIVRRIKAGTRVQSEFEVPTTPTPSVDASVS